MTCTVLVSLEWSGNLEATGAVALVDIEARRVSAIRFLPVNDRDWLSFATGLARGDDGSLWVAARRAIAQLDPATLEITRGIPSPLFGDLHSLLQYDGRLLVVSTRFDLVAAVDPTSGRVETFVKLPNGMEHHANTLNLDEDGSLLLTCHGNQIHGTVWRIDRENRALRQLWTHSGAYRLRAVHDGMRVHGELVCAESASGCVVWRDGRRVDLGGWCRGMLWTGDLLVLGVNRFHQAQRNATVQRPEIVLMDSSGKIQDRFPLGLEPPLQTYAIIPAKPGDLGVG